MYKRQVFGRIIEYKDVTSWWLHKNRLFVLGVEPNIIFRPNQDFTDDHILKYRMYEKYIKDKYEVMFVVEDRKRIVDMWRELGITCLQCADGDF